MPTASLQMIRLVITSAAARGVAPSSLLAELDVSAAQLLDPDGRVPAELALRAWQLAADRCQDPTFGLSTVERLHPDLLSGLGWALYASATVREGLDRLIRFLRLGNQHARLRLVEEDHAVRLQLDLHDLPHAPAGFPEALRHPTECLFAALVTLLRRATGRPVTPLAVSFRHAAPSRGDTIAPYLGRLAVVPRFGAACSELVLPRAILQVPHLAPDPQLTAVTERHLRRLLDELPRADTFACRVRRALAEELRHGEPSLPRLAERLRCSERTLQRRLQQEGCTIHGLLGEVRLELAIRHLRESRESIAEISFLLGFSEVRAFHRAFKRWTGTTPTAFRATPAHRDRDRLPTSAPVTTSAPVATSAPVPTSAPVTASAATAAAISASASAARAGSSEHAA